MKVFRDDKVYVQLKDVALLFKTGGYIIPQSVFKKSLRKALDIREETKDNFIMFDTPEELNLFKNVDYIVDFDIIKDMDQDEYDVYMMKCRYNLEKYENRIKNVDKFFHKLDLNDKYRKEMHKLVGSREARKTRRKSIDSIISESEKKRTRCAFFNRRNK